MRIPVIPATSGNIVNLVTGGHINPPSLRALRGGAAGVGERGIGMDGRFGGRGMGMGIGGGGGLFGGRQMGYSEEPEMQRVLPDTPGAGGDLGSLGGASGIRNIIPIKKVLKKVVCPFCNFFHIC